MFARLTVKTHSRTEFVDITALVQERVRSSEISSGICQLFVPHTTAGITINENADPSVVEDILMELNKVVPFRDKYAHMEGNSAAHIKSSIIGPSLTVLVEEGRIQLGTWQGIYFCEFDGPRSRQLWMKVLKDS